MEKLNFKELANQLSEMTKLDCNATDDCIFVHPSEFGCIWTTQLDSILRFCKNYNLIYFIDFVSKSLRISYL